MLIDIKRDRNSIISKEVKVKDSFESFVLPVYQNDSGISEIIMEAAEKNGNNAKTIGSVGCRYIAGIREIQKYLSIPVKEIDDIADSGDWKSDSWADGSGGIVRANIIDFFRLITKINAIYSTNFKYAYLSSSRNKYMITEYIKRGVCPIIKMPNLVYDNYDHFVNADAYLLDDNYSLYLRMAETFKGYDGYNGRWVEANLIKSFEFIYI